ncbi:enoyl-CoA hydratase/isomerase family protein [Nocardia vinacea]|uniref:enoyl-CoA hydratase/isomerase family protein n=1 Tax=Nocardia vinacea TaxID=96468 RepID=UPI002E11F3FB|nr:enoyl-CoA hydratase/isomerase family protein [Nocardia vinacea]
MSTNQPGPVSGSSTLDVTIEGPVAWVRFDRPEARNTVIPELLIEMHSVLTELSRDEALAVVVLTGNGSTFCPGADLNRAGAGGSAVLPPLEVYQSATLLYEMPQLTLAAVNGACAGPGFAWAAACDLRVAAAGARFATAFLQAGVSGELGLPWTLARALGAASARDLCFLPRKLTADEVRAIGFVSRVFPDDEFDHEVADLVRELAARRPAVLRTLEANFLLAERTELADYIAVESERHHGFFTGEQRTQTAEALRVQSDRVRES